jgi:peroxiredoxin
MEAGELIDDPEDGGNQSPTRSIMLMQKLTSLILILMMMAAVPAAPSASIPRKSPEFTIHEPSGKQVLLSSFKGKVVMIEFFFIRSPKCLSLATTMNKLGAELGGRGFQPVAVAFPAPGSDANGQLVGSTADYFKLTYPVGYANKNEVDQYLNRTGTESLRIPQVVIIDRSGTIRAQTGGRDGNLKLENEDYLRTLLDGLLKESAAPASPAKVSPTPKSGKSPS